MTKRKKVESIADGVKSLYNNVYPEKETIITVKESPKRIPLPQHVMLFQAFAYLASTKLKPVTNKVLMFLFSRSVYENFIGLDVKTIAEELNMTDRSIISALKELEDNNIIIKTPNLTDKRRHDYFINPTAAWKGNGHSRMNMMKKLQSNKNQISLFNE
jgi:hypothetical protein